MEEKNIRISVNYTEASVSVLQRVAMEGTDIAHPSKPPG